MKESADDKQRFFDAMIDSYTITPAKKSAAKHTASKLMHDGILIDTIIEMSSQDF